MTAFLMIAGGLVLLVAGAEILVRGAVSLARMLNVSPFLIGLTLVAYGTSTPELVISITAVLADAPGIVIGNIVGTNTVNILLMLGIAAVVRPIVVDPKGFRRDTIVVMAATLSLVALALYGSIDPLPGAIMVAALVAYTVYVYRAEKTGADGANLADRELGETAPAGPRQPVLALGLVAAGLAATVFGADLLVDGAIAFARLVGVSETVIALTIVAAGTSAPELVTSVMAAWRRQSGIAYGLILGSNIFNILFVLGATAVVRPIAIPSEIARFDVWVMLGATALLAFFARSGFRLERWEGAAFVAIYVAYVVYLYVGMP